MKIAVIFDSPHPEWEEEAFKREVEQKVEEAEYDVARALMAGGHDVLMIGIGDDVPPLLTKLNTAQITAMIDTILKLARGGLVCVIIKLL